ncbi:MAG: acyl--CoA ligase, partial [Bdellovibrionales bacterium]|nr:acyl--CoA ligase [Bdellovibrionales bacterium]
CCDTDRKLTWSDLWSQANLLAYRAIPSAITGQSIALIPCFSDLEFYPKLLACWMRNLVACPINPDIHESEMVALLRHLPRNIFVFHAERHPSDVISSHVSAYSPGRSHSAPIEQFSLLMLTSGSTGDPKAVLFTEAEILAGIDIARLAGSGNTKRLLNLRPLFTAAGLYSLWPTFWSDRKILLSENALKLPHAESFLAVLEKYRPDDISAPIAYMKSVARGCPGIIPDRYGEIWLRVVGQKPTSADIRAVLAIYPFRLMIRYAMTECIHTICTNSAEPGDFSDMEGVNVGGPLPGFSMSVDGNIRIRSEGMSHASFRDGCIEQQRFDAWFDTGDEARLREDGTVFLLGRGPSWICRAGFRFSCYEIEDVLLRHGQVSDAAVVAVPNDKTGESPHAFVSLREGSVERIVLQEIKELCYSNLSPKKIPVGFSVIQEIPMNAAGKRDWRELMRRWRTLHS